MVGKKYCWPSSHFRRWYWSWHGCDLSLERLHIHKLLVLLLFGGARHALVVGQLKAMTIANVLTDEHSVAQDSLGAYATEVVPGCRKGDENVGTKIL